MFTKSSKMSELFPIHTELDPIDLPSTAHTSVGDSGNVLKERKSVYIRTFGCQMNEYDSQKLAKILEGEYDLVSTPEEAELILINTCSVREKPEHKLYSLLGQVKKLKGDRSKVMVGVGGCVAQQEGETIVKRSNAVDFVFGTHNLSLVPSLIERRVATGKPQVAIDYRDDWEDLPLGISGGSRVSALVSISRGCNKNCTYCIVPVTRGKEVSRSLDEILREIRIAVVRGAKEIVLLGQTVNSYGLDLSPRLKFTYLLEKVAEIGGVERIRFTSPHPQEIRKDFIDLVCDTPKICHHVHMPLQSGSDRILRLMNRNYRSARYLKIIEELYARVPDMGVTTDIIVGFPGETDADFRATLDVMNIVKYQNSYSFMYSKRPGTVAETMEGEVPHDLSLARLQELQELQQQLCKENLQGWVGKEVEVLIDGPSKTDGSLLQGRSSQNITVNLAQEWSWLEPGDIVWVKIDHAAKYTLKGVPCRDRLTPQILSRVQGLVEG
jgi:tRNA-2-methylthio-N6-dimethylallyladenosine synthase